MTHSFGSAFEALGKRLRKARKWKQRTFRELTEESGVPTSSILRIEAGAPGVSLLSVMRLAHTLQLQQFDIATALTLRLDSLYRPSERLHSTDRANGPLAVGIQDVVDLLLQRRTMDRQEPPREIRGLAMGDLPLLATIERVLPDVSGLTLPVIWWALDAGYVITFEDVARYVADRRRIRGQTLAEMAGDVGRTASYIQALERNRVANPLLVDILRVDAGLDEKGRFFTLCWAAGQFQMWAEGRHVFPFCPTIENLTAEEIDLAKAYVRLTRTDAIVRSARGEEHRRLWEAVEPQLPILDPRFGTANGQSA